MAVNLEQATEKIKGRDERYLAAEYVSSLLHFAIADRLEQPLHNMIINIQRQPPSSKANPDRLVRAPTALARGLDASHPNWSNIL